MQPLNWFTSTVHYKRLYAVLSQSCTLLASSADGSIVACINSTWSIIACQQRLSRHFSACISLTDSSVEALFMGVRAIFFQGGGAGNPLPKNWLLRLKNIRKYEHENTSPRNLSYSVRWCSHSHELSITIDEVVSTGKKVNGSIWKGISDSDSENSTRQLCWGPVALLAAL